MLRKRPGVTPIPRRKMEVRWLWSTNPSSSTIQARDWCVRRIRVCVRQSTLYHLTQRPNPGHFFEVVGAQTGDVGEHGERKILIEMRLDVVVHPPQPLDRETNGHREIAGWAQF